MSDITFFIFIIVMFLVLATDFSGFGFGTKKINKRLDKLEKAVAGLQLQVPHKELDEVLRSLLQNGQEVEAVKLVRKELNLDLLDAKKYVDSQK